MGHGGTCPFNLFEDLGARCFPDVSLRGEVALGEVTIDGGSECGHASEALVPDSVFGEIAKEPLDQIHPGTGSWREMDDHPIEAVTRSIPRIAPFQPRFDVRMLVGAIVIDDEVKGDIARHFPIELLEEREPFDVRMLGCDEAGDLPIE